MRADGGVEQLTWRAAPAGHGRPHGVSDAAAERGVHAAAAYGSFVENRAAFIGAARDIQNTHLALSDAECAAPMEHFPGAHADVLKMRAPPHVTDPKYKIDVGAGLVQPPAATGVVDHRREALLPSSAAQQELCGGVHPTRNSQIARCARPAVQ